MIVDELVLTQPAARSSVLQLKDGCKYSTVFLEVIGLSANLSSRALPRILCVNLSLVFTIFYSKISLVALFLGFPPTTSGVSALKEAP